MKKTIFPIICVSLIAFMLNGCGKISDKEVIARIDQKNTITLGEFNDRISQLPERYQEVVNKNKKAFLDELVVDMLLHKEALRKKINKDKETKKMFKEAKKKIIVSRLLKDEIDDKITVTEEEIQTNYDTNKQSFTVPEVLRASHILVENAKEAEGIRSQLLKGKSFEDLAREKSTDPTAKVGGDIGYFTKGQLVPEFEEACFSMQVGDISKVVKTKFGYHVIKLTERREPRVKELIEVHDSVAQSIARSKKKMLFDEFVEGLKEKSKIIINNKLLKTISEFEEQPETTK